MAKRQRLPKPIRLAAEWVIKPTNLRVGPANSSTATIHVAAREKNGTHIDKMYVSFHGGCGSMSRRVTNRQCKGARASADIEFSTSSSLTDGPEPATVTIRLHKHNTSRARYRDAITPRAGYTEEIADIVAGTPAPSGTRRTRPSRGTRRTKSATAAGGGPELEHVIVYYPESRMVRVDGEPRGLTNTVLRVTTGRHTFTLEGDRTYEPSRRRPLVTGTSARHPQEVYFEERKT